MNNANARYDYKGHSIVLHKQVVFDAPTTAAFDDITSPAFGLAECIPDWVEATFLEPASPVHNPDHVHLRFATIGFLWTIIGNSKNGRSVIVNARQDLRRAFWASR